MRFIKISSVLLLIIAIIFGMATVQKTRASFSDVPESNEYSNAITYVKNEGIIQGYSDGTYQPDTIINRAEFTKIITEAVLEDSEINNCSITQYTFSDVPQQEWFAKYVCIAKQNQIIGGYPDGSFQPASNINFVEAAKIIAVAFGSNAQADNDVWYLPYVTYLENQNAIPLEIDSFDKNITRGEMAEMIYRIHAEITNKPSQTYASIANVPVSLPVIAGTTNDVTITTDGTYRYIMSNGIPDHLTGTFPNAGNPNSITEQDYDYRMPLNPELASSITQRTLSPFGVAINGVPFDPGAAEFWNNDRNSGWQYEALSGAINLGLDEYNAHVQPTGAYHYHGIPVGITQDLSSSEHSPLIGYAADGFPVYVLYGYSNPTSKSAIKELKSSYRVKSGTRPGGPGGTYDGSFIEDYEYVASNGDLDECNGRTSITPEFPQGTYHYVLTQDYPVIPRCLKGTPDDSFSPQGGGGPGGPGGPPGGGGNRPFPPPF